MQPELVDWMPLGADTKPCQRTALVDRMPLGADTKPYQRHTSDLSGSDAKSLNRDTVTDSPAALTLLATQLAYLQQSLNHGYIIVTEETNCT
jgi:hypothetical protein